jgi:small subunit ribosomal protein S11
MATTGGNKKRKSKRVVNDAVAHVTASFNNTVVAFSDNRGDVIAWATTGSSGFKGARKGTPYAAQVTTENAARKAQEIGVKNVEVRIRGVGAGRDAALRSINNMGFRVTAIRDVTPMPHNGCRPPKRRRV